MENKAKPVYADGIFVNAKQTKNGSEFMDVSIGVDRFIEFLLKYKDEKGYTRITIWPKPANADTKYGTHSAQLNQWQPPAVAAKAMTTNRQSYSQQDDPSDLPF